MIAHVIVIILFYGYDTKCSMKTNGRWQMWIKNLIIPHICSPIYVKLEQKAHEYVN